MCPVTKSVQKALRQSIKRRERNRQRKKKIKELQKKVRLLVSEQKRDEAQKLLPQLYKVLDKAAKVGMFKKNTASRKKSRIARAIG